MQVKKLDHNRYMVEGEKSRPDSVDEYLVSLGDDYGCSCQAYHFNHKRFEVATGYKYRCKHIDFLLRHLAK